MATPTPRGDLTSPASAVAAMRVTLNTASPEQTVGASVASFESEIRMQRKNEEEYRMLFAMLDEDNSGGLDVGELKACFDQLEIGISEDELNSIISKIADDSGNIMEDDFVRVMCHLVSARQSSGTSIGTRNRYWRTAQKPDDAPITEWVKLKAKIWVLMDDPSSSALARAFSIVVVATILMSVTALVVESYPQHHDTDSSLFFVIELFSVIVFTVEYLLRFISCSFGRWEFAREPLNAVDVVAIAPFYLELILGSLTSISTSSLRVVRLVRVFRMFKISRYMAWLKVFYGTIKVSAAPLGMITFVFGIVVIVFSSLLYYVERGTFDEELRIYIDDSGNPSPWDSIPASMWFVVVTMTTIGFGDIVPISSFGKLIAGMASVSGVLMLAIPISVITASFESEHNKASKTMRIRLELEAKMKGEEAETGAMDAQTVTTWYLRSWLGLVKGNRQRLQASLKQVELQSREQLVQEASNLVDDMTVKLSAEQKFVRRVIMQRQTQENVPKEGTPPKIVF